MVAFACASCQMKLSAKEELAGQRIQCSGCGQSMLVPGPVETPAPAAAGKDFWPTIAPTARPVANGSTEPPTLPPPGLSEVTGDPPPFESEDTARLTGFLAPPQSAQELGRLGDFRILKILGHGGMGVVFQGEDPKLGRKVAIKAMLPDLAGSQAALQRFLSEARMAATLEHDHIVPILQVGEDRGTPFIVMPFLKGEPLDERLKREQKLAMPEVLRIGREIARGLGAAHAAGLIHRDIKPANIWLETPGEPGASATGESKAVSGGRVKILDFGLARVSVQEKGLTSQGAILGTPAYMAPEQARGEKVGTRCDLWSLGVLLYRACTGRLPFEGTDAVSTLVAIATKAPAAPAEINPEVPAGLSELVLKLLAKDAAQRPASAQEVVQALRELEQEQQATQELPSPLFPFAPTRPAGSVGVGTQAGSASDRTKADSAGGGAPARKSRRPLLLGIAGALVAVALTVLVFFGQTPQGLVRIESDDPGVEIVFDKTGPTVKGGEMEALALRAGEHGVVVKRGETVLAGEGFVLGKGATITLRLTLQQGKMELVQDGKVIATRDIPLASRFTNSLGMAFALVPRGKSWLGGGAGKVGTKEVEIPRDFYLGVYEVTQEEWEKVMDKNPSKFKAVAGVTKEDQKRFPVENMSWEDAQAFVKLLNEQVKEAGWEYRLPTEVEWEYACRGGPMADKADSAFDFYLDKPTNELKPEQANFNHNEKRTCKVGSYAPNRLGLYDMHGNVWEWCADEVKAGDGASLRVARGGGWNNTSVHCWAAPRDVRTPSDRSTLGIRLARVPSAK